MKRLLKITAVLLVLVIAAVVAAYFYLDRIVKVAIERGSTYALGVDTELNRAQLSIVEGRLTMHGLHVANPQGFQSPHFMMLNDGNVAVTLASLREDTVEVAELNLSDINVNLEKKAKKSNYQIILDNLKRFESADSSQADGKRYIVRDLEINNIVLHIDTLGGGDLTKINISIDEIKLQNVGSDTPRGLLLADLTGVIIKAIFAAALDKAGSIIPDDIADELTNGLAQLEDLAKIADVEQLGKLLKPVGEVGKPVEEIGGKVLEGAGKFTEGLGGLLGGDKKEKK